jgi:hypothetical protein
VNRTKNELAALTRLFSATVFRQLGRHGQSPLFSRLVRHSPLPSGVLQGATVGSVFEHSFNALKESGYRDEYVYKSAIAQKIVLGRHSLNTATVLNEARAGSCKADVVVLNGTATVYEIKSERDSLARLRNQLENYLKVFAAVNVVASPAHVQQVASVAPSEVGVLVLSRQFTLQTVREADDQPGRTSPPTMLETLRASEALAILQLLGVAAPEVPNTRIRSELRTLFEGLNPELAHNAMVRTLKRTRSQSAMSAFVRSVPKSLRAAALSTNPSRADQDRILQALSTPLDFALAWK